MNKCPVIASSVCPPEIMSAYPEPFASLVDGRIKKKLGDHFDLTNFGVNLTSLSPGAMSALLHHHSKQDEFIYILEGSPTLILAQEKYVMSAGDCYGFKAGSGIGSQLINQSGENVIYLEIGSRTEGDIVEYPNEDLKAIQLSNGIWKFSHKDGQAY